MNDVARTFLQKDYELRSNYLCADFGRMWQRFNFFIVKESGLSLDGTARPARVQSGR